MRVLVQDRLRSASFSSIPFFDQKKVLEFLNRLEEMGTAERVAADSIFMWLASASVLQERFKLSV